MKRLRHPCRNWNGRPKIIYPTLEAASVVATRQSAETNIRYEAYGCRECEQFHVGRPPKQVAAMYQTLIVEIGWRAASAMFAENSPTRGMRSILRRFPVPTTARMSYREWSQMVEDMLAEQREMREALDYQE